MMETKVPNFVSTMSRTIKCNHCSKLFVKGGRFTYPKMLCGNFVISRHGETSILRYRSQFLLTEIYATSFIQVSFNTPIASLMFLEHYYELHCPIYVLFF